tara:strand:+ start:1295 stop:1957 length:663 start_codon:yes stop_codon:yes gene_type:complete
MSVRFDATSGYSGSKQTGGNVNVGTSSQDFKYRKDYVRLKILYDRILYQLRAPMTYYTRAEFDYFLESTPDILIYTKLLNDDSTFHYGEVSKINSYEYDEELVTNFRTVSNNVIDTIKQAMSEYIKIRNLENENEDLKTYKEILHNKEKLEDYLEELQRTSQLFSVSATLTVEPGIKPYYREYFILHGPPGDGVFESDKLAVIIKELIESGEITEDELIF